MPVIYVIHPNKEELSKVRSILSDRDFLLMEYENGTDARNFLNKKAPDVCLMPMDITTEDGIPFANALHEAVLDCPIVILAERKEISGIGKMVSENLIFDYFLLNPVVDAIRLHIIIDKALTQSAVQLNLQDLKRRLKTLPEELPEAFEEQARSLQRGIVNCLNNFKERMKGHEFKNIVTLLDEDAFDSKFAAFQKEEIHSTIEKSNGSINDVLVERLTQFTTQLEKQIDEPPDFEELQDLRNKLVAGSDETENLMQNVSGATDRISTGVSLKASGTILFIDDVDNPSDDLVQIIESFGHTLLIAQSPLKLIEMVRFNDVDLVICGYNLGRIDGIEAVRRIRDDVGKNDLPVIMLAGNPTPDILEKSKTVGICEIVTLPMMPKTFQEKICLHMK